MNYKDYWYKKYKELTNMRGKDLISWSNCKKTLEMDRSPLIMSIRLQSKRKMEWTAKDTADAKKAVNYISLNKHKVSPDQLKNWAFNWDKLKKLKKAKVYI